ncbi:MAG: hypothetical protein JO078_10790 [Candidatus Eremiobacteraeota bacterium]|nr:hypothetical protein [Candidatus Eremiobacteraeota bacterium]MBV9700595.1 hypothetical protein [Candidatus Eremiobacteraeota bacterium]
MKLTLPTAFLALLLFAGSIASAETISYTFTGLPGAVDSCKWFDDNLNDRDIGSLTRQTDLLYNRVALPVDQQVAIRGTALTERGEQLADFDLGKRTICAPASAIYGPTPEPSESPTPLPT